jgi:hypothetical protein
MAAQINSETMMLYNSGQALDVLEEFGSIDTSIDESLVPAAFTRKRSSADIASPSKLKKL